MAKKDLENFLEVRKRKANEDAKTLEPLARLREAQGRPSNLRYPHGQVKAFCMGFRYFLLRVNSRYYC